MTLQAYYRDWGMKSASCRSARELNTVARLSETTHEFNGARASRLVECLEHHLYPGVRVAVLGLAYKPNTHVIEESPGVALTKELVDAGCDVVVYDPLAMEEARRELGDSVVYAQSLSACVSGAEVVAISEPDPAYAHLTASDLPVPVGRVTVVDCWRLLRRQLAQEPNVNYVSIGVSASDALAERKLRMLWEPTCELQPA
jgi:UDPglucose 6-dehydrogenase